MDAATIVAGKGRDPFKGARGWRRVAILDGRQTFATLRLTVRLRPYGGVK
jgi:hypothetical protein